MEALMSFLGVLNSYAWGAPMLILIGCTGLYLMVGLKYFPLKNIGFGFKQLFQGRKSQGEGDIPPFHALMTALSATVGTGNIAGVATAIFLGGPGAIFWMWMIALVGMATKYAEAVLAVKFREKDKHGHHIGGPMYYIKNGLGKKWVWLGYVFAFFGALAGFGIGNSVQANSVSHALYSAFEVPPVYTGLVLAVLVGLVLIGGIKRLGDVAGKLVPIMAVVYVLCGLLILIMYISDIPAALLLIVESAFSGHAAAGGFAGATMMAAIQFGIARGVFSNEAGLGSAPIAHAAAATNNPVKQGTIAMLGTFIDTIIICSITALCIIVTGAWQSGENGAALSSAAFATAIPGGEYVVTFGLMLFAFTTLLGWSFYGEKCVQFLFGESSVYYFRALWILVIPVGALAVDTGAAEAFMLDLKDIWLIADTLNALMALPNLIALLLLSPIVFTLTRDALNKKTL